MVSVPNSLSNKMRNMSIVCAFLVVMIHCRPAFREGSVDWWVRQFIENGIACIAVPYFFICSGYFVAKKLAHDKGRTSYCAYKAEVFKRIRTLLVPYMFWILAFWLMLLGGSVASRFLTDRPIVFSFPTVSQWGLWPVDCPMLSPLWYLRALMVLVVVSPLLLWAVKRFGIYTLLVLFIIYGVACPFVPMYTWGVVQRITRCGIVPVLGVFYFSLGIALWFDLRRFRWLCMPPVLSIIISMILIGLRAKFESVSISCYLGMFSIPFALYGFWKLMPDSPWPRWLVSNSFAIYLIHKFLLQLAGYVVDPGSNLYLYFITALLAFSFSLLIAIVLKSFLPKFAGIVFGGR